jgi:hypothetical protein
MGRGFGAAPIAHGLGVDTAPSKSPRIPVVILIVVGRGLDFDNDYDHDHDHDHDQNGIETKAPVY